MDSRDEMIEGWIDYRVNLDKPMIPSSTEPTESSN
jgi:hypothetical protein